MSYFGTDGIRGEFGVFPITPDFLLRLGFGAGRVLVEKSPNKRPSVLIGKDTRLSGYVIEAALQAGFNAAGVDVYMLGPLPTPAIAHLVKSFHADMGVVISASHNPYQDNGVKFFSHEGKKISDDMQNAINAELDNLVGDTDARMARLAGIKSDAIGKNHRVADAKGRYIEYCKGSFPYHFNLSHLKIVVDCANGAGYSAAPRVLKELGAQVIAIHNTPDGVNINDHCGSTHPEVIQAAVREHGADVGIALDGDGDRIIMTDEQGNIVDGDGILYILAKHLKPAGVVGTLMSNVALELALADQGIDFHRAKVGDRYVMQDLEERGWSIGGEPSGHILCLDKSRTGDAIVAGLQVLSCMAETGKALSELIQGYTPFPQKLINVRLSQMSDPYANEELKAIFDEAEKSLLDQGRLLIRKSGTEPVIRVMVEHQDESSCQALAEKLAAEVKRVLA
ncbi:phosphoglucosamine mutase [Moraxella catarrhalis]|uniref:Phosphoglucosamine mutase n=1 Tax=Moraxella catarrhalis TaxID=480 RepID=A0A198UII6_MORCA|nr:phosphoglucosamine mutase [Moraxella catarrhalis]OAU96104.1 Phosphoglucosamine mutase [Moraxella catarrhalis]OAU96633.1 Phosphoglucosamine mutase [Moraxella catarrhalis]OAV00500.1 Phosphoglucosamine mutase [Moraxella catarrhalis]